MSSARKPTAKPSPTGTFLLRNHLGYYLGLGRATRDAADALLFDTAADAVSYGINAAGWPASRTRAVTAG